MADSTPFTLTTCDLSDKYEVKHFKTCPDIEKSILWYDKSNSVNNITFLWFKFESRLSKILINAVSVLWLGLYAD